ncbi:MAG: anthranilate phosphoribosyltransferase [Gammaproteobacteria bacterium]
MDIQGAIRRVIDRRDLDEAEMAEVMTAIMSGAATPSQIAGLLVGLRMKGETVAEITAAARVMRRLAVPVATPFADLVDIVGTGGDASGTFNISTACAFVAAAAGARVAKHGNRAASSRSGSADLLEAAGVAVDLEPDQIARCIGEVGVGFMFAPRHHGAMRHAMGPRRELAVRTLFNLLGPLTNPAGATRLMLGVFDAQWVEPIAQVAGRLGARHALVVHADDGMDEISISSATQVAEYENGAVRCYTIRPEQFGIARCERERVCVQDAAQSKAVIDAVFAGERGPARDIVLLNAGAALYVAGIGADIGSGIAMAARAIDGGGAREKLAALAALTRSMHA